VKQLSSVKGEYRPLKADPRFNSWGMGEVKYLVALKEKMHFPVFLSCSPQLLCTETS